LNGPFHIVKLLAQAGATLEIIDGASNNILLCAIDQGRIDIVVELGFNLCRVNYVPEISSVLGYPVHVIKHLIDAGVDINQCGGDQVETTLITAAYDGHKDAVITLLRAGADPNITEDGGWAALGCCSWWIFY
jgi:ankyrin repeat protein